LPKKSLHGGLRLTHLDQPPVSLPRHRVNIPLPQIPNVIRLIQLLHRSRIVPELLVVELNRPDILIPPVHRLHLTLPPQIARHRRRRHPQHQQDDEDRNHQPQQQETLLTLAL
jgi:hypothetical protein